MSIGLVFRKKKAMENKKEIFVIRPSKSINIKRI